ncbi:hypothetical protein KP003_00100 [Geomonas nitrogeniifigens]|uniref:TIGR03016 family PEP-CTERM system-associated outer membrane protein n=1 Tax=Geomonas diazotrophica TaxID=2843197 RepID=A0ABX8JHB9_9BACT|nr:hypothetical protein [Geomonas nitrogeniifigens]QWV97713.1 hypothetical protein KP005_20685 [Geomonas nitrogeniifigens]QXE86849.1 hypothetical protein KP003_00100 [Geomonas nitrogeniifigens]
MPLESTTHSLIPRPGRSSAGAFFVPCLLLAALFAAAPPPAGASYPEPGPPAASATSLPAQPDIFPLQLPGLRLDAPSPVAPGSRTEFRAEYPKEPGSGVPAFVLQRGEYGGSGYKLLVEMGDLQLKQTRNTLQEVRGRGGRFSFLTGSFGNRATLETFATSDAHGEGADDTLVGATGELSLLDESASFKTILLSGRKSLDREGRWPAAGARRGDVAGFVAQLKPLKGLVAAEAEYDCSSYDASTSDLTSPMRDTAYRLKLSGGWGPSRYTALYERTGPRYLLMSAGPPRDREGGSFGVETVLALHAFDVKLSRYNDNVENNPLAPRVNRYEGVFDYRFRGVKMLPLALQYRKTVIDSGREPLGTLPKDVAEDAVSGQLNYLAGSWDLGVRGGMSQRIDRLRQQRELATTSLGFLPRFSAGSFTLLPDLSLKRITDFNAAQRTDQYALNLGVSGKLLEKRVDYEIKGGYKRECTGVPGTGKETFGAKLKAVYPLARFFNWSRQPSLAVKGEYNEVNNLTEDRRENDFSLLISLDGGSFL